MSIRVSASSYLNAAPFVHGLQQLPPDVIKLSLDEPVDGAQKMLEGDTDVALIPILAIQHGLGHRIISDYCIGAVAPVASVCLYANSPVEELKTIYLDPVSVTSSQLTRVLAKEFWKIDPVFRPTTEAVYAESRTSGYLIIGDKTFGIAHSFPYAYDLAEAWLAHTGLPFVFAAWVAAPQVPREAIGQINKALELGIRSLPAVIGAKASEFKKVNVANYLTKNISYPFDEEKKRGMQLFLSKLPDLEPWKVPEKKIYLI